MSINESVRATPPRTVDGERLIAVFSALVEPIGRALPNSSEVLLHDLSLLPNSIVAVYGDITGRRVGDPATDLLLEQAVTGFAEHSLNYETRLADGRKLTSSTMIIRDVTNNPVAALCINTDMSAWVSVISIARSMMGLAPDESDGIPGILPATEPVIRTTESAGRSPEVFVHHVDELASQLIYNAINEIGLPVSKMKKEHKVQVVRRLKATGMFLLRDAVEMIAESLEVTRFTIYNYLHEVEDAELKEN